MKRKWKNEITYKVLIDFWFAVFLLTLVFGATCAAPFAETVSKHEMDIKKAQMQWNMMAMMGGMNPMMGMGGMGMSPWMQPQFIQNQDYYAIDYSKKLVKMLRKM